jgi:hypothetical protein
VKGGRQIQWRRFKTRCSSSNTAAISGSSVPISGLAALEGDHLAHELVKPNTGSRRIADG